ncbi:unnamed protein product [Allacma fusca]|uniref:Hexosyltransferase n=1 Tax=Allacma fusca TaxID=39272 RepID=A0A8J2KN64_9HEXA|nr:unnamed protein product [Allacma fusca]
MGPSESRKNDSYFFQLKLFLSLYVIIDISGVFRHPLERDYYTEFSYPLEIDNFPSVVERFRQGEPVAYDPINLNYSTLKYITTGGAGCRGPLRLLILVKSALTNFKQREVIRQTWGYTLCSKSNSVPRVLGRTAEKFFAPVIRAAAFADKKTDSRGTRYKLKNSPTDFDIDLDEGAKLYAGYVFFVPPHRHKVGTKWFLPLSEYPFNYFPPYVPAGAIIMSKGAFLDIYYASYFTKHFRFDDIYVALCAKKMGIEPYHTNYFRFWPAPVRDPYEKDYEYVITSHGFDDPEELRSFWNVEKSLGQA